MIVVFILPRYEKRHNKKENLQKISNNLHELLCNNFILKKSVIFYSVKLDRYQFIWYNGLNSGLQYEFKCNGSQSMFQGILKKVKKTRRQKKWSHV